MRLSARRLRRTHEAMVRSVAHGHGYGHPIHAYIDRVPEAFDRPMHDAAKIWCAYLPSLFFCKTDHTVVVHLLRNIRTGRGLYSHTTCDGKNQAHV